NDVCRTENQCSHQGKHDVERHIASQGHQDEVKALKSYQTLGTFSGQYHKVRRLNKARRAEVKVANFTARHNLLLAVDIFPDGEIAKNYSAASKTTCMLNGALKPYFLEETVKHLQKEPLSLSTNGSNDTEIQKMNPITVKLFDANHIHHRFLGNIQQQLVIFQGTDCCFQQYNIPWYNCVSFSLDNTFVNMDKHNSLMSRAKEKNKHICIRRYPCHIIHNTASKASAEFAQETGSDLDDFCIDVSYWFAKSMKRKARLEEYCQLCNQNYKTDIDHVSTRWLSLEMATYRILKLFVSLESYFSCETGSQTRFQHLKKAFLCSITEVYLMFFQLIFPLFTNLNKRLQREEPVIYLVYQEVQKFLKNTLGKFVTAEVDYKNLDKQLDDAHIFNYENPENQKADQDLYIGFYTKQHICSEEMQDDTECDQYLSQFYKDVRNFYCKALSSVYKKLPVLDETLKLLTIIDYKNRDTHTFDDLVSLLEMFPCLKKKTRHDIDALVEGSNKDGGQIRMDTFWHKTGQTKDPGTGRNTFVLLPTVMKQLFVLLHSNADCKSVLHHKKNRTKAHNELSNAVLKGLLATKVNMLSDCPCFEWKPSDALIKKAKSATS
uniref:HAT C-terminal dimerisation domain-containing protein n=1 Tax=Latimeria chalumnae TaxID=7897 RepID=H3A325_LATCH